MGLRVPNLLQGVNGTQFASLSAAIQPLVQPAGKFTQGYCMASDDVLAGLLSYDNMHLL